SARVAKERATFVEVRRALATQIAEASATTAKLTDEVVRLEGRARELVEAKLRAEAARLDDAERRLRAAEDDDRRGRADGRADAAGGGPRGKLGGATDPHRQALARFALFEGVRLNLVVMARWFPHETLGVGLEMGDLD